MMLMESANINLSGWVLDGDSSDKILNGLNAAVQIPKQLLCYNIRTLNY